MSNDCTQGSPVQFLVIWDDDLPEGIATTEDHVASFLPPNSLLKKSVFCFAKHINSGITRIAYSK